MQDSLLEKETSFNNLSNLSIYSEGFTDTEKQVILLFEVHKKYSITWQMKLLVSSIETYKCSSLHNIFVKKDFENHFITV